MPEHVKPARINESSIIQIGGSARFKTAQYLASTGASALEVEPVEDKISVEQGEFGDKTTVQTLELVARD